MPVPFTSLPCIVAQWLNNKLFWVIWKLQIYLGLCFSEKCYLVEFLLGRKREREVRFWIMCILNVISAGRKGIKFFPISLCSYKRKKTGCICVMCRCLKVVLLFILCTLFWNAVGNRKIRRIMIQWWKERNKWVIDRAVIFARQF